MPREPSVPAFADRAFRQELRKPVHLRAFLRRALPEIADRFDYEQAEYPDTKMPFDDWRGRESDLLVELPFRTDGGLFEKILVCILLEHQSKTDARMPLRTLVYSALYWDRQWRAWESIPGDKEPFHLRPLLPVVLYANTIPWGSARTLADLFHPDHPFPGFIPRWEPLIWELSAQNPAELLNSREAFDQFLAVVRAEDEDTTAFGDVLKRALEQLQDEHADQKVLLSDMLRLVYAWAIWRRPATEQAGWNELTTQTVRNAENRRELKNMGKRAIEEIFEQGIEAGILKGKLEGKLEGRLEGKIEGKIEGNLEGRMESLKDMIIQMCRKRFGSSDSTIEQTIREETDLERLQQLCDRAITAKGWGEILG